MSLNDPVKPIILFTYSTKSSLLVSLTLKSPTLYGPVSLSKIIFLILPSMYVFILTILTQIIKN